MKTETNIQTEQPKNQNDNFCRFDAVVGLPFYEDEYCQIYNCDSLTAMVALRPSRERIVIITDPPYGIGASNKTFLRQGKQTGKSMAVSGLDYEASEWDAERLDDVYIAMLKYVSKNQIIFGGNYYGKILGDTRSYIVWDKDNGDNLYADCELAWTSFDKAVRKIKHKWHGMLQQNMGEKEKRLHPTQKPLPIMQWIVENYITPADIIVDPFMGSGTTLVAAKSLGRKAIGMEINKAYCEIAVKRLLTTQIRMTL